MSKQKKSNLKILTCRKQYLHHVMTFAESILKLSEKVTIVQYYLVPLRKRVVVNPVFSSQDKTKIEEKKEKAF